MARIATTMIVGLLLVVGPPLTGIVSLDAQTRGPFGVRADVNGTTVTLSWELPPGTNVFLEVFVRQGPRIFAGFVGPVSSVTGTLPPGAYSFVIGSDATTRLAGADFTVVGGGSGGLPGAPSTPTVTQNGSLVTVSWTPAASGGAVVDYQFEAGSAPGASNIAIVLTAIPTLSAPAPPGIYYVRVRARNASGLGPASVEVVINVTGGVPTPAGVPRLTFTVTPNPVPFTGVFPGCAGSPITNKTWVYTLRITNQGTGPFNIASFSGRVTSPLLPMPVDTPFPRENFALAFGASTIPPQGALEGPLCVAGNYDNATLAWTFVDVGGAAFTTPVIQFLRGPF